MLGIIGFICAGLAIGGVLDAGAFAYVGAGLFGGQILLVIIDEIIETANE